MPLIEWIQENRPGRIKDENDRFEIIHSSRDHSTLWKRLKTTALPKNLNLLADLYAEFDGIDLFSSTFKIASIKEAKSRGGVNYISTLDDYQKEIEVFRPKFKEKCITFMMQQGIGIYSIGIKSGIIYEFDIEFNKISGEFNSIYEIFTDWIKAIEE